MALTPSNMLPLGTPAPDFSLPEVTTDERVALKDLTSPVLVVMFICRHCPYVKHINGQLAQLGIDYAGTDVSLVAISANDATTYPDDAPPSLAQQKREFGFRFPYLHDASQEIARAYQAACTPDFYVFGADRRLLYRGQLDDSRPGNGKPVTGRDLRAAIEAARRGEAIDEAEQRASIGCNIKWRQG